MHFSFLPPYIFQFSFSPQFLSLKSFLSFCLSPSFPSSNYYPSYLSLLCCPALFHHWRASGDYPQQICHSANTEILQLVWLEVVIHLKQSHSSSLPIALITLGSFFSIYLEFPPIMFFSCKPLSLSLLSPIFSVFSRFEFIQTVENSMIQLLSESIC